MSACSSPLGLVALVWAACGAPAPRAERPPAGAITFDSLLADLVTPARWARAPDPWWTTRSFTSTDPRSVDPATEGWFADDDRGHYLRTEVRDGRTEHVLAEALGPGAIVRIWAANPQKAGTLRVYLDGAEQPVLAGPAAALLGGHGSVPEPLAQHRGRGHVMLLPIPFARSARVTVDRHRGEGLYYAVQVRSWPEGTPVWSLGADDLGSLADRVGGLALPPPAGAERGPVRRELGPGERVTLALEGPGAVERLEVGLEGAPERATREVWLVGEVDGERVVEAPVGGFFGSGLGINPTSDLVRTVSADGTFTSRWVMPFGERAELALEHRGEGRVAVRLGARVVPWDWDARSLVLHASHRRESIPTVPRRDWEAATVVGEGIYLGDTLEVANPVEPWWGAGDEKIRIDGEAFPSHFGTGTEDYYGYAYCSHEVFAGWLHAQPRSDAAGHEEEACAHSRGNTTNTRVRALDALAFRRSLDFDLEVWHWEDTTVELGFTAMWYARPPAEAR